MSLIIGSHVSYTKDKQMLGSVIEALSYDANTFMFYTGAPQNTARSEINPDLIDLANDLMTSNGINIEDVIVHAPYIINPANDKNYDFNVTFLKQELDRVSKLGITKMVLHPGSHVGIGVDNGIENIIKTLNECITEDTSVITCLETMAGKGSEIGRTFEELKRIIDGIKHKDKVAVCLDTCHINDAGYDLNDFDKVLDEFDKIIGLDKLLVLHINDSKNEIGAHKDRHDNIGYGTIGFDNLMNVIYNKRVDNIPKILETPYVDTSLGKLAPYKLEIEMIRNKKFNDNLVKNLEELNK
jgi:deoxyribonuclease-4